MKYLIVLLAACSALLKPQQQTAPDTLTYNMDQVTVTATRYTENIIEIPYAVSVITGKQLQNVKGYGMDEVLSSVPGVLSQSRSGNQDIRITIRGFGARGAGDRSNSGTSRGIRIMIDGMPETEPDGRTSFDQIDLSLAHNIEVIRSNASAMWGNASGGIINISSVPNFSKPYVSLQSLHGSFGLSKYTVQGGSTVGNGKLFVSAANTNFSGWRQNSKSSRTVFNAGIISNLSPGAELGVYLTGTSNMFHIPGPLSLAEYTSNPEKANSTYLSRDERRHNRLGRLGVTFRRQFEGGHEISTMAYVNPKYLQRSERGTFRDFTRIHTGGNIMYRNTHEFNGGNTNIFAAGADESYQDGAVLFYSLSPANGRGNELRTNKREGANSFGAFIHDEFIINDKISLIAGARYDNVAYYSEDFMIPSMGMQIKHFEKITPKAGITYRITPVHSIYANLGGGVEVPAGNETDPAGTYGLDSVYLLNPLLEPITSATYEVGTKQIIYLGEETWLRAASYDIAAYYIDISNDIVPYRGGRFYFTAGRSYRTGIEAGGEAQLKYGFTLNGAFTYSINKYKTYLVDSVHYGSPGSFADYSGNKAAGIPDMFYSAGLKYEPEWLKGIFFSMNLNGTGSYFADDANTISIPEYKILNVSAGLSEELNLSSMLGIRGFVSLNNVTDAKYAASAFINPDYVNGSPVYLEPGLPRNITVSVSLTFK